MGHLVAFVSRDCVFPNHCAILLDILSINDNINVRSTNLGVSWAAFHICE